MDEFLRTLGSNLPQSKNRDRMRWKLTKKGDFDIRSFYNKLQNHLPIIFPWKGIWKVKAPPRVSFFVWTATWNKILIGDNLWGRVAKLMRSSSSLATHYLELYRISCSKEASVAELMRFSNGVLHWEI